MHKISTASVAGKVVVRTDVLIFVVSNQHNLTNFHPINVHVLLNHKMSATFEVFIGNFAVLVANLNIVGFTRFFSAYLLSQKVYRCYIFTRFACLLY